MGLPATTGQLTHESVRRRPFGGRDEGRDRLTVEALQHRWDEELPYTTDP